MGRLKRFLLSHEPFLPMHAGLWIRLAYFRRYFFRYAGAAHIKCVLDAGCGRGRYAALVAQRFPEARVTGYDLLPHEEWKGITDPRIRFEVKDLHAMTDEAAFDAIVSVDSLEHIPDNRKILAGFRRALRPGGILYVAFPNDAAEWHFFPQRWFAHFHEWEEGEHVGEQYSLADLTRMLEGLGFETLLARHSFTFWGSLAWEIEYLLYDHGFGRLHVACMPLMKLLGLLDLYLPIGSGHNVVVARAPSHPLEDSDKEEVAKE